MFTNHLHDRIEQIATSRVVIPTEGISEVELISNGIAWNPGKQYGFGLIEVHYQDRSKKYLMDGETTNLVNVLKDHIDFRKKYKKD